MHKFLNTFIRKAHVSLAFVSRYTTLGARILLIDADQSQVLLVRSRMSNTWSLPGGGVEVGETCAQAAQRECKQEVGFYPVNPTLFSIVHNPEFSNRDHVVIFTAKVKRSDIATNKTSWEIGEIQWFNVQSPPQNICAVTKFVINDATRFY